MNSPTSKAGLARRTWARISSAAAAVSSDQAAAAAPSGQAAALPCAAAVAACLPLLLLLPPAQAHLPSPAAYLSPSNTHLPLHRLALPERRFCQSLNPLVMISSPGSVQTSLAHHRSACSGRWNWVSPDDYSQFAEMHFDISVQLATTMRKLTLYHIIP